MKKVVLTYGLIAGLVVSAFMATSMTIYHNNPDWEGGTGAMIVGYLSMLISFSMIYVAVKTYRDKYNNGVISFGKAFRIGLFIALIASTMYVISWALVYNFIMPDFMDKYAAGVLKDTTLSPAEVQAKSAEMAKYKEMYKNPVFFALFTYMEILPVGIVVSLIIALILKRKATQRVELEPA
jgi:hypothetical protein